MNQHMNALTGNFQRIQNTADQLRNDLIRGKESTAQAERKLKTMAADLRQHQDNMAKKVDFFSIYPKYILSRVSCIVYKLNNIILIILNLLLYVT